MSRPTPFTLQNLKDLDLGKIEAAFNTEVKNVVKDCQERPVEKKARTVAIVFNIAPVAGTDADHVSVTCDITSKIPTRKTRVYDMKTKQDGSLIFHPDLPDEPEGDEMFDQDVRDRERRRNDAKADGE